MKDGRKALMAGLAGVVIGALLMAMAPAGAGNGDRVVLGRKNYASKNTLIKGKGTVVFENTTGAGEPAASFRVVQGPPLAVNSSARIPKLNADQLDGRHASDFALDDEGLMGDYLQVVLGQTAPVVTVGPWTLELRCDSLFYPPPVTAARLRLSIAGSYGVFVFGGEGWSRNDGNYSPFGEGYLGDGQWGQWNVTHNTSVGIGQVRLDAVAGDGTVLRVMGSVWSDPTDCEAALQVIPIPNSLGEPLPAP